MLKVNIYNIFVLMLFAFILLYSNCILHTLEMIYSLEAVCLNCSLVTILNSFFGCTCFNER